MKFCGSCGGRNATGAAFCQRCGAPFRISDAESAEANARVASDVETETTRAPGGSLRKFDASSRQDDAFGESTKEFASIVGASVLTIVVAFARWFCRLFRPLARSIVVFAWEQIKTTFSPSATWRPDWVPNFMFWGVLGAFLWRLPTSWVGIVYAVLANEARRIGEFDLARERAESAKNWLIADFIVGLVVCVFRNLVF